MTSTEDTVQIGTVSALGDEIAKLRGAKGLTQEELAHCVGHETSSTISKWEKAERLAPASLAKLAKCLGVPESHFAAWVYNRRGPKRTKRQRETNTKMVLDSTAELDTLPRHSTTVEGGVERMLSPGELEVLGIYRQAMARGGDPAADAVIDAARAAMRSHARPKSPAHSGGTV